MKTAIEKTLSNAANDFVKEIYRNILECLTGCSIYDEIEKHGILCIKINSREYSTGDISDALTEYLIAFNGRIAMPFNQFMLLYDKMIEEENRFAEFTEDIDEEYQENIYKRKDNVDLSEIVIGEDDSIIEKPDEECPVCLDTIEDNEWYLCLECGKILCKNCFIECASRTKTCPVCNAGNSKNCMQLKKVAEEWCVLKCLISSKHD
jgi:hypothetical protein